MPDQSDCRELPLLETMPRHDRRKSRSCETEVLNGDRVLKFVTDRGEQGLDHRVCEITERSGEGTRYPRNGK